MPIYKTVFTSFIFIIVWNANYFLCLRLSNISKDSRFFDDYSISMVYIFGAVASAIMTFDVRNNLHKTKSNNQHIKFPKIISMIGAFFLWLSFCMTFSIVGIRNKSNTPSNLRAVFYPEAMIGIFFALSSCVISTMGFSVIFNRNFDIKTLLGGCLGGAIMFGPVASFAVNISVPISLGIISGYFSVLYHSVLMPRINKKYLNDSLGLLGSFSLPALIGVLVIAPIVGYCYKAYENLLPSFMVATVNNDKRIA